MSQVEKCKDKHNFLFTHDVTVELLFAKKKKSFTLENIAAIKQEIFRFWYVGIIKFTHSEELFTHFSAPDYTLLLALNVMRENYKLYNRYVGVESLIAWVELKALWWLVWLALWAKPKIVLIWNLKQNRYDWLMIPSWINLWTSSPPPPFVA